MSSHVHAPSFAVVPSLTLHCALSSWQMQYPPSVPPKQLATEEWRSLNLKRPIVTWHPQGVVEEDVTAATVAFSPNMVAAASQATFVVMVADSLIAEAQVSLVASLG